MQPHTAVAAPVAETRDGCPAPLAWREVLEIFRAQRRPFEVAVGGTVVRGAAFGGGVPLYFLNGGCGDHEVFALTGWLLREEIRCVFFDYPALAAGDAAPLETLSAALFGVADRQGDSRFSVLTAGLGSLVALRAMLAEPDRIDRAVLVCGCARRQLSFVERGLLAWGRRLPLRVSRLPGWRSIQEQNHRRWFPPFDSSRWELLLSNHGATRIRDASRRLSILVEADLRPRLRDITRPVLLVQAEGEGRVAAACREELESGLPQARTEPLHTTGQLPYLTHPHRLAKLVREFFADAGE